MLPLCFNTVFLGSWQPRKPKPEPVPEPELKR